MVESSDTVPLREADLKNLEIICTPRFSTFLVVFCENEIQGFVQSHYTVYAGNIFS
jgi:hypothetical protein